MIAGGGTGGHLFPGVALAEEIAEQGGEVCFVGTARGIEARVIPARGYRLELIDVAGIKGGGIRGLVRGVLRLPRAWLQSRRIVRSFRPDVVVGVGGYASGPVVATAATMCVPTAILEQNSVPGVTNRILGKLVRKVFGTFPDPRAYFPKRRYVIAGNPVRAQLLRQASAVGHAQGATKAQPPQAEDAGLQGRTAPVRVGPRLLVFGGSQGARAINDNMVAAYPQLRAAHPGIEILHQTGESTVQQVKERYAAQGGDEPAVRVVAFIEDMASAYAWADLAVCRAGATSLAELAALEVPAILIPFPHAADNHQEHNARALVATGAAELLLERDLTASSIAAQIGSLLSDADRRQAMRAALRQAARPNAAQTIYAGLCDLVRRTAPA